MPEQDAEVLIVGAGVAGLTLAALLGRQGRSVLLIDKAAAPRDKVCGEGIMPLGMGVLEALGLSVHTLPGVDFAGLDYWTRSRRHALHFRPGVTGRGMRRTALIDHLQAHALRHPSVTLHHDAIVAPEWSGGRIVAVRGAADSYGAPVIVAADGVNSVLARRGGAAPGVFGYRMGVRRHYRLAPDAVPRRVQVGLFGRHDVYLTPVAPGELLATTMTDRAGYGEIVSRYEDFLRTTPFAPWFAQAEPASEVLGWYHPLFRPRSYTPGGVWLVGDASGGIDPCLGMGISMALAAARQAGELLGQGLADPAAGVVAEAAYARWRGGLFHHYHGFGKLFRLLVTTQAGGALLVSGMRVWPSAADRILGSIAEMRPWPMQRNRLPGGVGPTPGMAVGRGGERSE